MHKVIKCKADYGKNYNSNTNEIYSRYEERRVELQLETSRELYLGTRDGISTRWTGRGAAQYKYMVI